VILGTLLLGAIYLASLDGEQQGLAKSALAVALLNANHYFWQATGGYFDRPANAGYMPAVARIQDDSPRSNPTSKVLGISANSL
jgi:hypothetical protein